MPGFFNQLFNPKPGVFQSAEVKKAPKSTPTTPRDGRPSPEHRWIDGTLGRGSHWGLTLTHERWRMFLSSFYIFFWWPYHFHEGDIRWWFLLINQDISWWCIKWSQLFWITLNNYQKDPHFPIGIWQNLRWKANAWRNGLATAVRSAVLLFSVGHMGGPFGDDIARTSSARRLAMRRARVETPPMCGTCGWVDLWWVFLGKRNSGVYLWNKI